MTSPIELNPQLCEMPEAQLDRTQRNLLLAFVPNLGAPLSGPSVGRKAFALVDAALQLLQRPLGPWELAWGPGVFQLLPRAVPANTMFVARHRKTGELCISIAGTNPFSAYAWFAEDFDVDETRAWGYGDPPEGVALSKGTLTGLRALQGMVPPPDLPGQNQTLVSFLKACLDRESGPVEVTVTGHSLGGALSPTLALWLLDTRHAWDPDRRATLSVYAYAGPTPGNADFADYANGRLGDRLHRIANPLDVVTRAWNVSDLAELKALYTPAIARDALWDKAADSVIAATNGIPYRQIDPSPLLLPGKLKTELVWRFAPPLVNLIGQVLYQHTLAYFELLGLAFPEEPSTLGRKLAHQTDDVVREILERVGVAPLLSRGLALGLRLLTEAYSHTPFLPSPVPERDAAAAARSSAS